MESDETYGAFCEGCKAVLGFNPTDNVYQNCVGCQTPDDLIPEGDRLPRKSCLVRQCVDRLGVLNCAYCSRFPCGSTKDTGMEWGRENVEPQLGRPVSDQEYFTYVEPFESWKHLEAIRATLDESEIVAYVPLAPPKIRLVDFPLETSLSEAERGDFRALYELLFSIKHSTLGLEDTDTFAQAERLKDRVPIFLRFLWIVGLFGEFDAEGTRLVVEPKAYIENRGSQSPLAYSEFLSDTVFVILAGLGVRGEVVPKEKGWTTPTGYLRKANWELAVSFDDEVGGIGAMKALQVYTRELNEEYGKRGFSRFSNIDMRLLVEDQD
jgi:hypothetical protein